MTRVPRGRYNIGAMTASSPPALQTLGITKAFPGVLANDRIDLSVAADAVHAIIGENGAGKSTLVNILFGRYAPDSGRILFSGREVHLSSPAQAIALGIGIVTQHSTLIPALTVLENIILGAEPAGHGVIRRTEAAQAIHEICDRLNIFLNPDALAVGLSLAATQKAEIVKALFRGAKMLILDEPTAALAPQEAENLFALIRELTRAGSTVLFITHKLSEVINHADHVTVLRGGRVVGDMPVAQTNADDLLNRMVGAANPRDLPPNNLQSLSSLSSLNPAIETRNVTVTGGRGRDAISGVSLSIAHGEIVGVAGVDGSGQRELAEAIIGLRPVRSGSIFLDGVDITKLSAGDRYARGLAYIPEDRHRDGLVMDFTVAQNLLLGRQRRREYGGGIFLDLRKVDDRARQAILSADIRVGGPGALVRTLSGGNQQRLIIARALDPRPTALIAMQPTRGLDVASTCAVYDRLREAAAAGAGVLFFSLDLDELLTISDRIAVMFEGRVAGILARAQATPESLGRLMLGNAS